MITALLSFTSEYAHIILQNVCINTNIIIRSFKADLFGYISIIKFQYMKKNTTNLNQLSIFVKYKCFEWLIQKGWFWTLCNIFLLH